MNPEQNSISIINKTNGQVLGESAQALPIIIRTSLSGLRLFVFGSIATLVFCLFIFLTAASQVETVEIVDTSSNLQILKMK